MTQTNKPIHKQGHCPICNSKNLKYNRPTYNSEYVYFDFDCLDCGCLANEQLKAEFIGTLIFNDDFTETFVNVGDETIGETK